MQVGQCIKLGAFIVGKQDIIVLNEQNNKGVKLSFGLCPGF